MSACVKCNNYSFTLDRSTGEMKCNSCGTVNYVGSPECYGPSTIEVNKKGEPKRNEFMDNAISKGK